MRTSDRLRIFAGLLLAIGAGWACSSSEPIGISPHTTGIWADYGDGQSVPAAVSVSLGLASDDVPEIEIAVIPHGVVPQFGVISLGLDSFRQLVEGETLLKADDSRHQLHGDVVMRWSDYTNQEISFWYLDSLDLDVEQQLLTLWFTDGPEGSPRSVDVWGPWPPAACSAAAATCSEWVEVTGLDAMHQR